MAHLWDSCSTRKRAGRLDPRIACARDLEATPLTPATLGHVKLPVSDLAASKAFYNEALAPLGFELVYDGPRSLGWGPPPSEFFAVELSDEPILGVHVAFNAVDQTSVDAFHASALAAGGSDNGLPGLRPYGENYYAAFVLDPDGHNIEAVHHGP